ncbi:SRPBCC family protein [Sphaerisporangium corydalis]|uniref:SRPBCC domain-containing protein n=1 Tax=Sphaerisporangium corydalis TaxID=1441875 RepID=A0ABV9ENB9_9ACTN|nr:SRPBCC domain-containing protein [Sphaerisporangium corydalis]
MRHEFEVRDEIALDATPEQVWEAISTGPGIDSWFMGRNEVEPREGGTATHTMMGYTQTSTVTAWEPSKRFAYQSAENPDGTFMAFDYLIEGRAGASTVLRLVHSGFLGDDWEAQYDALKKGDPQYMRKLAAYLKYFPGRHSTFNTLLPGPQVPDQERVWEAFKGVLGLTGTIAAGDRVRLTVPGLPEAEGVVASTDYPSIPSVCTDDALYMFMHGYRDTVVVEQHSFIPGVDAEATDNAWKSWLATAFA